MTRAGELEVTLEPLPEQGSIVHVEGDLDMASSPSFEEVVGEADLGSTLVFDLSECTFLDSSAVRVLMSTARAAEAAGGRVSIVATNPGILRVLEIAAVDTMLPVHTTVESAL